MKQHWTALVIGALIGAGLGMFMGQKQATQGSGTP